MIRGRKSLNSKEKIAIDELKLKDCSSIVYLNKSTLVYTINLKSYFLTFQRKIMK